MPPVRDSINCRDADRARCRKPRATAAQSSANGSPLEKVAPAHHRRLRHRVSGNRQAKDAATQSASSPLLPAGRQSNTNQAAPGRENPRTAARQNRTPKSARPAARSARRGSPSRNDPLRPAPIAGRDKSNNPPLRRSAPYRSRA